MANFVDIEKARQLLGLGDTATLREIKTAYRTLAHRYHPDKQTGSGACGSAETMKRINWAYKLLNEYCNNYRYSFSEQEIARIYPYEEYLRNFKDRWYNTI